MCWPIRGFFIGKIMLDPHDASTAQQGMDGSPHILGRGMTMGLFNNETERNAALDPSVVMPQSLPAQAVSVPPPSGPDTTRAGLPHKATYAQIASARAYLDQGSKISGKLVFEGPAQIEGQVDGEISAMDSLIIGES